jgi:hypothetical protein
MLVRLALVAMFLAPATGASGHFTHLAPALVVAGWGTAPCSSWTEQHVPELTAYGVAQEQWVVGYLSGAIIWMSDNKLRDKNSLARQYPEALTTWMSDYCADHPSARIVEAAGVFMEELESR